MSLSLSLSLSLYLSLLLPFLPSLSLGLVYFYDLAVSQFPGSCQHDSFFFDALVPDAVQIADLLLLEPVLHSQVVVSLCHLQLRISAAPRLVVVHQVSVPAQLSVHKRSRPHQFLPVLTLQAGRHLNHQQLVVALLHQLVKVVLLRTHLNVGKRLDQVLHRQTRQHQVVLHSQRRSRRSVEAQSVVLPSHVLGSQPVGQRLPTEPCEGGLDDV